MKIKRTKINFFWTIWAIGFYRVAGYKETLELRVFIGPAVITFW